jgi:hypothetical protein
MKELLFENPLPLYVALGLVEIVIAGLWYRGKTRRLAVALLIPPLLAGAVLAMDLLVETDREKLQKALREIAADVERGDLRGVSKYLADDYYGYGNSREGVVQAGEQSWRSHGIRGVGLTGVQIEVHDNQAKVQARTIVTYNAPGFGEGRVAMDWTVYWGIRDGQWRIVNVEDPRMGAGL